MFKRKPLPDPQPRAEYYISYAAQPPKEFWEVRRRGRNGSWDYLATYASVEEAEAAMTKFSDVRYYDKQGNRLPCGTY